MLVTNLLNFSARGASSTEFASKQVNNDEMILFDLVNNNKSSTTTQTVSEVYELQMTALMSVSMKIADNAELLTYSGAGELASIIHDATAKSYAIINTIKSTICNYSAQINTILLNPFLSESEKRSKIEEIELKIEQTIKEASIKITKLYLITEVIASMSTTFVALQNNGYDTTEITIALSKMINGINTKPSDFSECNTKKEMWDEIDKNEKTLFGKNQSEFFMSIINNADKRIKEIEEKLEKKDLEPTEKKKLKNELILYKALKSLFESFE